jgi:hypothetical protein
MSSPVPDLDYTATARRPAWTDLPDGVRRAVAGAAGAAVLHAGAPATSGFSGGFAAVLDLADGRRVFAKAGSSDNPHLITAYAQEAIVLAALPGQAPAPRLVGSAALLAGEVDDRAWQVVVAQVAPGRMPHPWTDADLSALHDACLRSAAALTPPPPGLDLPGMPDQYGRDPATVRCFADLASGRLALAAGQPVWVRDRYAELQALVDAAAGALEGGTANHGDVRADNVLVHRGRAVLVDWNWLAVGPTWTDFVGVLPLARADGLDADRWLAASPLTREVDPAAVDAWLAVIAAYMLANAGSPVWPGGPPTVRTHQRRYARTFLDWLGARRGWA